TGLLLEGQVQSLHNAQGQRVVKSVGGSTAAVIHFIYDQAGRVIAEIDAETGVTTREYIYVNGIQVALVDDTGTPGEVTYFVHSDHLGTPQKITDDSQVVVWGASYEPFGEVTETVAAIENNIRFPGQYEDGETGLNYNYFRDYDPSLGRYVESDPIGLIQLEEALNLYSYVNSNPIRFQDQAGLQISFTQFAMEHARRKTIELRENFSQTIECYDCEINCVASLLPTVGVYEIARTYLKAVNRLAKDKVSREIANLVLQGSKKATLYGAGLATAHCVWTCE
ncbi:MAG: hypothetical protein COB20_07050, partial [SAR86 cluster bacterium]